MNELVDSGLLPNYPLLAATRADFLRRLGRNADAASTYRGAIESAGTDGERRYLRRRLGEVTGLSP